MLWVKAFHIVAVVSWFAGLFYLPRLFVYHSRTDDALGYERFSLMERKLYNAIMTPAMVLTVALGLWLWLGFGIGGNWLYAKLALVFLLLVFHFYCGALIADFAVHRNRHGQVFYRWLNEVPTFLLIAIVILVVVKPW